MKLIGSSMKRSLAMATARRHSQSQQVCAILLRMRFGLDPLLHLHEDTLQEGKGLTSAIDTDQQLASAIGIY